MNQPFEHVPLEEVQRYWDSRPCNLRHSTAPVGTREYFDQVEQRKYFVEPHILAFADFASWKGKRVLEIGCGIGTDTINFARAGADVTAVDLSGESVWIAKQRAEVYSLSHRINFLQGNCEELDHLLPIQSFDLIYSFGVLHHTPRPERAIAALRPFLKSDGEFRLMLYSKVSYKLFWIMREEGVWNLGRMDELIAKNSEAQTGCPVTYTYTLSQVPLLLKGFEILDLYKAHIFTWELDAYLRHEYVKDPAWAEVSDSGLAELERELGWHTMIRARLAP